MVGEGLMNCWRVSRADRERFAFSPMPTSRAQPQVSRGISIHAAPDEGDGNIDQARLYVAWSGMTQADSTLQEKSG